MGTNDSTIFGLGDYYNFLRRGRLLKERLEVKGQFSFRHVRCLGRQLETQVPSLEKRYRLERNLGINWMTVYEFISSQTLLNKFQRRL